MHVRANCYSSSPSVTSGTVYCGFGKPSSPRILQSGRSTCSHLTYRVFHTGQPRDLIDPSSSTSRSPGFPWLPSTASLSSHSWTSDGDAGGGTGRCGASGDRAGTSCARRALIVLWLEMELRRGNWLVGIALNHSRRRRHAEQHAALVQVEGDVMGIAAFLLSESGCIARSLALHSPC